MGSHPNLHRTTTEQETATAPHESYSQLKQSRKQTLLLQQKHFHLAFALSHGRGKRIAMKESLIVVETGLRQRQRVSTCIMSGNSPKVNRCYPICR